MITTTMTKAAVAMVLSAAVILPATGSTEPVQRVQADHGHSQSATGPAEQTETATQVAASKPQGVNRQEFDFHGNTLRFANTGSFMAAGVTWDADGPEVTEVLVRAKEGSSFGEWESLEINDGTTVVDGRMGSQPLVSNGADGVQARLITADGSPAKNARLTLIDPGTFELDGQQTAVQSAYTNLSSSQVDKLRVSVVPRAGWGADESIRKDFGSRIQPKAMVIHHTASTNSYTKEQASAQVRAIYLYQAKTLGWGDIGYNFLVDKFGTRYEGRYGSLDQVRTGAHTIGVNDQTMAISALGNYETADAPKAMVDSISSLAAWQMAKYDIDPTGSTRLTSYADQKTSSVRRPYGTAFTAPTLFGHVTTSYTACPGKYLIADLPAIKNTVATKINAASEGSTAKAPAAKAPVKKAPAKKSPASGTTPGTYTVKPGDSWWLIADRLDVPMSKLASANGKTTSSTIHPGMVLKVPSGGTTSKAPATSRTSTYTVKPGDSWWLIAYNKEVSMNKLASVNGKTTSSVIHPGMVLRLP